ncbi:hypothetical protein EW026_g3206 [Hermanssonia centrifuga]|uniref:SUN domain-containing protein n=1 Tax=Hermanssonia centrifuga TaxID=98765 RepID=A0A4S4KKV5_9APHY|nr:hypothetical protein EW026_g3206 [Hermanssonia centrifuga]
MSILHTFSVSYQIRAPTLSSRSPPKPERSAITSHSEEQASDSDQPALVRFARLKQREQAQQHDSHTVGPRVVNTPPNPDRWSVKDTSVNIASAFHRAATYTIPAYDTSASSTSTHNNSNTSNGTVMNPNDSWASGTQHKSALPRSTSVEYEKETQSTVNRRLAIPPTRNNGIPRPLSKSHSIRHVPDSEGEEIEEVAPNARAKTPFEHVMDATRRLAPATFFMRRQSEEPEARPSTTNGRHDQSSSYDYSAEEREFQAASQQQEKAKRSAATHKRGRISVDNKAYRPSVSDLDDSEDEVEEDGKRTKRRKAKKTGAAGGPLTTLPVAGYDKRKKKRRSGARENGTIDGESSEEDQSLERTSDQRGTAPVQRPSSVQRTSVPPPSRMSVPRSSVPPESRHSTSGYEASMDVESGLHSIQEVEEGLLMSDEPAEQISHRSFSVGALLGRGVHLLFSTFWLVLGSLWSAICYLPLLFGRALGYAVDLLLKPVRRISNVNPAPLISFGKYATIALSLYVAWATLNSGILGRIPSFPSLPTRDTTYHAPEVPPADVAELSARLLRLENALSSISVDAQRSRMYIEGDSRSHAELTGRLGALESRIQKESSRVIDTENKFASTSQGIQAVRREVEILHAQLETQKQNGKHRSSQAANDEEARLKLKVLEERMGSVEGGVKEALELGQQAVQVGGTVGAAAAWWAKLASGKDTSLTIKSSDGQDVGGLINHLVDSALSKASKDMLARPDYALYSGGAAIIPSLTSDTFELRPHGFTSQILGMITGNGFAVGRPPVTALHHEIHNGHCWPFEGSQGQLGVKLSFRAYISDVTVDHVAREVATDMRSTPREMELWGLVEGSDNIAKVKEWMARRAVRREEARLEAQRLGEPFVDLDPEEEYPKTLPQYQPFVRVAQFTYDMHAPNNIQTFPVPQEMKDLGIDFGIVVLLVKSNWGRDEYTCLYRLRVHGERMGGIQAPLVEEVA